MQSLGNKNLQMHETLSYTGPDAALVQLARWLSRMADNHGALSFRPGLTQQELADMLGVHRAHWCAASTLCGHRASSAASRGMRWISPTRQPCAGLRNNRAFPGLTANPALMFQSEADGQGTRGLPLPDGRDCEKGFQRLHRCVGSTFPRSGGLGVIRQFLMKRHIPSGYPA